jgi:hypothetical protein
MPCNARENQKTNLPLINPTWRPRPKRYTSPPKKQKQKQTYDLPSGRHVGGPRWQGTPPGPETEFRKEDQTEFPRDVPRTKFCTVVVLSSEEGPKAGKAVEGVGVREREDAHSQ